MTKDEALALALNALHTKGEHHPRVYEAIAAIQTVLAQPVQEPVVWDKPSASFNEWWDSYRHDNANPFDTDSFAYWAWAGWKAALRGNNT